MLNAIIYWSLRHSFLVIAIAVGLAVTGAFSLSRLPIDAFPDTTPVQVQVNTVAPALAPVEIELRSDSAPDLVDVQLWLMRAARLYVDYKQDGLSDGTAILSIDWKQLKETTE